MKGYLRGWTLIRLMRLILGGVVLFQAIQAAEWIFIISGGFLFLMPLLNIGCCGASGCRITTTEYTGDVKNVTYEEVR